MVDKEVGTDNSVTYVVDILRSLSYKNKPYKGTLTETDADGNVLRALTAEFYFDYFRHELEVSQLDSTEKWTADIEDIGLTSFYKEHVLSAFVIRARTFNIEVVI